MRIGDWCAIGVLGGISLIGTVYDIRFRKIPYRLLVSGALLLVLAAALPRELELWGRLFGLVPGGLLWAIGKWTDVIGEGDCVLIAMFGFGLGIGSLLVILSITFTLTMVVSFVLLLAKRLHRRSRLPFFPFVLGGYVIALGLMGGAL